MDGFEFTSSLVEHLVWPGVAMYILLTHKGAVGNLLERLTEFEGFGAKAKFSDEAKDVRKKADELSAKDVETPQPGVIAHVASAGPVNVVDQDEPYAQNWNPVTDKTRDERLRASGLIIEEWNDLEESIQMLARMHHIEMPKNLSNVSLLVDRLMSQNIISEETAVLITQLRNLRNQVAHSKFEPTREAANDFAQSCLQAATRMALEEHAWQQEIRKITPGGKH